MSPTRYLPTLLPALLLGLSASACEEAAEPSNEVDYESAFPQDAVGELHVTVSAENWQRMVDDLTAMTGAFGSGAPLGGVDDLTATPVYVECTLRHDGETWEHVGIRFRGNSSLTEPWLDGSYKVPFRLRMDEFQDTYPDTDKQRFHGVRQFNLSNNFEDPSQIREKLASEVYATTGLPTPATAFYKLYIDHGDGEQYFGLYTAVELPADKGFLRNAFGNDEGNLYQPEGKGAAWAEYDETDYYKQNNEAAADFSDTRALFDALHADRTDAAAWRTGLEARLDVPGFLDYLATAAVIEDYDGYGAKKHNYFLYADEDAGGQFRWIPWDHALAFGLDEPAGKPQSLDMHRISESWPLIRFLLDDPTYSVTYRAAVERAAAAYAPEPSGARITVLGDLVRQAVAAETAGHTLLGTPADFDAALEEIAAHPPARAQAVATFLESE